MALGQVVRIAVKQPIRRELAAAPTVALGLGVGAVVLAVLGIWSAIRWPWLVQVAAAGAAVLMVAAWWRARPGYGRRRGWPPGSLGIRASIDGISDRNFYRDQARLHGPVFKMSQFGRPVVCVVGLAAVREILNGQAESLAGAQLPYNRFLPKGSLRYLTGKDHRQEAAVFRSALFGIETATVEEVVRAGCRRLLSEVSAQSRQSAEGVLPVEDLEQWVADGLARFLFGIGADDPRFAVLDQARRDLVLDSAGPGWIARSEAIFQTTTRALRDLERAAVPGTALGGLVASDPTSTDDPNRIRNLFLLFRIGVTDVFDLLGWLAEMLSGHPEVVAGIRKVPRTHGPPTGAQPSDPASRVVLETLRLEQSEYLYRHVVRPMTIGEYSVPAGWLLRNCIQESHRDPTVFPDPDRFDPDRFVGRVYGKNEYSPFGVDTHGCLGVAMVLFLGRIFVEELCHGYDLEVVREAPLDRGSRHRHHWRPKTRLRLIPAAPGQPRE